MIGRAREIIKEKAHERLRTVRAQDATNRTEKENQLRCLMKIAEQLGVEEKACVEEKARVEETKEE